MDDFHALGGLIIQRLKETLPKVVHVLAASDLTAESAKGRPAPAVYVAYGDDKVIEDNQGFIALAQTWTTWCAVRNVRDMRQSSGALADAGQLKMQVFQALDLWQAPDFRMLRFQTARGFIVADATVFYPLVWEARFKLNHQID
jgi:hypothetical protein